MSIHKLLCLTLLGLCIDCFVSFGLADETVAIADLPKAVMMTVTQRYSKAELTEARKTIEDKVEVFEIELKNGETHIEIAIFADGKIDWVAVEMAIEDLPKAVIDGIRKKYATAAFTRASTVYVVKKGKDKLDCYHVEITIGDGKKRDLEVSPKGTIEEDEETKDS